jgi:hypothetical protein
MGILESIKSDIKKSGQSKRDFIYFREGEKRRIRFLTEFEDAEEVTFHGNWEKGISVPCQELFGRDCEYCGDDSLKDSANYAWCVWDYEDNCVKIFMFKVNNCSPVPQLTSMYENYGTITDRDYVIVVSGKQMNRSFTVIPQDKAVMRNKKAKPFSHSRFLEKLDKAFPDDNDNNYDDEDDGPKHRKSKHSKRYEADDDVDTDDEYEDEDEDEEQRYEDMSAKELYKLCKERDIDVEPKKLKKFYINQLEEADESDEDWGDDDDDEDDDW